MQLLSFDKHVMITFLSCFVWLCAIGIKDHQIIKEIVGIVVYLVSGYWIVHVCSSLFPLLIGGWMVGFICLTNLTHLSYNTGIVKLTCIRG